MVVSGIPAVCFGRHEHEIGIFSKAASTAGKAAAIIGIIQRNSAVSLTMLALTDGQYLAAGGASHGFGSDSQDRVYHRAAVISKRRVAQMR